MSLESELTELTVRLRQDSNSIKTRIGLLSSLTTTQKISVVAAINELKALIDSDGSVTAAFNDLDNQFEAADLVTQFNTALNTGGLGEDITPDFVTLFNTLLIG